MQNHILCPKCQIVAKKNGIVQNKQRFKCRSCNYQFTSQDKVITPKRLSFQDKLNILYFDTCGLSCRKIAQRTLINRTTVIQIASNPLSVFQKEYIISDKCRNIKYIGVYKSPEHKKVIKNLTDSRENIMMLRYSGFIILHTVF